MNPSSAAELGFLIPLTKIDAEKRLVYGVGAQEIPDKTNEILDYELSKPNFINWSKSFEAATNGLSKGNVRVMHTKHVVGKLVEFEPDDENKRFNVCAKIVDDQEWQKVLQGLYTGFSVGGKYGKTWQDGAHKRYEAKPSEISLVDSPCIPTARFVELVKGDMTETLELRGRVPGFAEIWADRPRGFADQWGSRPQGFGELWKSFDESRHPRKRGKFVRSRASVLHRAAEGVFGGAAINTLAVAGLRAVSSKTGRNLGVGLKLLSDIYSQPPMRRVFMALGAGAGAVAALRLRDEHAGKKVSDEEHSAADLADGIGIAGDGAAGAVATHQAGKAIKFGYKFFGKWPGQYASAALSNSPKIAAAVGILAAMNAGRHVYRENRERGRI